MSDSWTPPVTVGIIRQPEDAALFARLGLQVSQVQPQDAWALSRTDSASLQLIRHDGVALCVDFTTGKARHRATESGKGAQALAKALGVRQYHKATGRFPLIVDATGGLGQDAWALASLGCTLHIIETHPLVHALLEDGLARALNDDTTADIAKRVTLVFGDAVQCLPVIAKSVDVHAIYLDPMYPARRKRASSKKGMQFLHTLLEPPSQTQSPDLLLSALGCVASRVAVKRPKGASLLAGSDGFSGQRTTIDSPNTRYDVYHLRAPDSATP